MGLETRVDGGLCTVRPSEIFPLVLMLASVLTSVLASVDMFGFASFPKWASGASGLGSVFRDWFENCASEDSPVIGFFSKSTCSYLSQFCHTPFHPTPVGSKHQTEMWDPFIVLPLSALRVQSLFVAVETSEWQCPSPGCHVGRTCWGWPVYLIQANVSIAKSPLWALLWVLPTIRMQVVGEREVVSSFWESQARRVKQNSHVEKHLSSVFILCSQLDMLSEEKTMEANLIRCIPGQKW